MSTVKITHTGKIEMLPPEIAAFVPKWTALAEAVPADKLFWESDAVISFKHNETYYKLYPNALGLNKYLASDAMLCIISDTVIEDLKSVGCKETYYFGNPD